MFSRVRFQYFLRAGLVWLLAVLNIVTASLGKTKTNAKCTGRVQVLGVL